MKNNNGKALRQFIVVGASTAGKSTFSHELVKKFHISHIGIDSIIEGFEEIFPELGITHNANSHQEFEAVCDRFTPFITKVINGLKDSEFVVEGFRMSLEKLHAEFPEIQFFAFGFPNDTPENHLARCRKYDGSGNWTGEMDDEELLEVFKWLIEESKFLEATCQRHSIPFFDTSREEDYWPEINKALGIAK